MLAGADLDDIAYVVDEYLAVADVAGVKNLLDCGYKSVDRNLGDYDVNLDFWQEACLDLSVYRNISDSSFFSYNSEKALTISFVMIVALLMPLSTAS